MTELSWPSIRRIGGDRNDMLKGLADKMLIENTK
jgi:hypothetical protein